MSVSKWLLQGVILACLTMFFGCSVDIPSSFFVAQPVEEEGGEEEEEQGDEEGSESASEESGGENGSESAGEEGQRPTRNRAEKAPLAIP